MDIVTVYYLLHVLSLIFLTATAFQAFAAPKPEGRVKHIILTIVLAAAMLTGGFGLLAKVHASQWHTWVIIKLVCWLGLCGVAGHAYRKPGMAGTFRWLVIAFVTVGVWAVYSRPTF